MGSINISVNFPDEELFNNCILPLKENRELTKIVRTLLGLYYRNDGVRALAQGTQAAETSAQVTDLNEMFDALTASLDEQDFIAESMSHTLQDAEHRVQNPSGQATEPPPTAAPAFNEEEFTAKMETKVETMLSSFLETLGDRLGSFTPSQEEAREEVSEIPQRAPLEVHVTELEPYEEVPSADDLFREMQEEVSAPTETDKAEAAGLLSSLKASLG